MTLTLQLKWPLRLIPCTYFPKLKKCTWVTKSGYEDWNPVKLKDQYFIQRLQMSVWTKCTKNVEKYVIFMNYVDLVWIIWYSHYLYFWRCFIYLLLIDYQIKSVCLWVQWHKQWNNVICCQGFMPDQSADCSPYQVNCIT